MTFLERCKKYAKGQWQKEVPQRAGVYATKTTYNEAAGPLAVYQDPHDGKYYPTKPWVGSFWSEPIPEPDP